MLVKGAPGVTLSCTSWPLYLIGRRTQLVFRLKNGSWCRQYKSDFVLISYISSHLSYCNYFSMVIFSNAEVYDSGITLDTQNIIVSLQRCFLTHYCITKVEILALRNIRDYSTIVTYYSNSS